MAHTRRVEVIEIPVEQLSCASGRRGELAASRDGHAANRHAAVGSVTHQQPSGATAASARTTSRPAGVMAVSFRRLIEVPGGLLPLALDAWWQHAEHDDRHLVLGMPRPVGTAWSLSGALRRTVMSRWVPVEVLLTPYAEEWTLLELMPRRAVHPKRTYFRTGHHSLDRLVAAIRAQDVRTEDEAR